MVAKMSDAMYDLMYFIDWVVTIVFKLVILGCLLPLTYRIIRYLRRRIL